MGAAALEGLKIPHAFCILR